MVTNASDIQPELTDRHKPIMFNWSWATSASEVVEVLYSGHSAIAYVNSQSKAADYLVHNSKTFTFDELNRAGRYIRYIERREFLAARGIVRAVLAALTGLSPAHIPFGGDLFVKPRLGKDIGVQVDISISHSQGWVACGFCFEQKIGVDIELGTLSGLSSLNNFARTIFGPAEIAAFRKVPIINKEEVFIEGWRRKEAILKGMGTGFSGEACNLHIFDWGKDGSIDWFSKIWFKDLNWRVQSIQPKNAPCITFALSLGG